MNRAGTFVLGVAVGATAQYLFDQDRGGRRRALLRDRAVHAGHELDDAARAGVRHVRNRAVGMAHELKSQVTERAVDDRVLEERVRSEAGRHLSSAGTLDVSVRDGAVTLAGAVPTAEVQEVVRATRSVRGVKHVDNQLATVNEPARDPQVGKAPQS
jgi:osmotically-inducible protein OsmY